MGVPESAGVTSHGCSQIVDFRLVSWRLLGRLTVSRKGHSRIW